MIISVADYLPKSMNDHVRAIERTPYSLFLIFCLPWLSTFCFQPLGILVIVENKTLHHPLLLAFWASSVKMSSQRQQLQQSKEKMRITQFSGTQSRGIADISVKNSMSNMWLIAKVTNYPPVYFKSYFYVIVLYFELISELWFLALEAYFIIT